MFTHPALLAAVALQQHKELLDEAAMGRLAASLRRSRRRRWPQSDSTANSASGRYRGEHRNGNSTREVSDSVGTLEPCEVGARVR